jgi:ubiquinone/menaquinone biosynthesis C-methylase UbiE
MTGRDDFEGLARYYDSIMDHIDYDRWVVVTSLVADWMGGEPRSHVDIACGTGVLLKKLRQHGWPSVGLDLSPSMAREASQGPYAPPTCAGDMCDLPLADSSTRFMTCFFDSLNFLLNDGQLERAFAEIARVLEDGGVYYFDMITERMVTEYFADQAWTEQSGRFKTAWEGEYDRAKRVLDLKVQVHSRPAEVLRERVYSPPEIIAALERAGLTLVGEMDAETWDPPDYKTVRVDMIAVKNPASKQGASFSKLVDTVQDMLADLG